MNCGLIACPIGRAHHHHRRGDITLPAACFCTRPVTTERPTLEQLLNFAATHPGKTAGQVEERLRDELHITPVRYLQLLFQIINTEEALEHDPQTTYRLRRTMNRRARNRAARTTGH